MGEEIIEGELITETDQNIASPKPPPNIHDLISPEELEKRLAIKKLQSKGDKLRLKKLKISKLEIDNRTRKRRAKKKVATISKRKNR